MRSLLFVPAHDKRKCDKALHSGADALILDLEDAVPDSEKAFARSQCRDFVQTQRDRIRLFVRINASPCEVTSADLAAIVPARPFGIVLPKCGSGRDVALLSSRVAQLEQASGIAIGTLRILPIVTETAAAVLSTGSYAAEAGPRLCGLFWGGEDLAADIGASSNRTSSGQYTMPYQLARALTLLGATAAGVPAIDAVNTDFRDPQGLRAEAAEAVRDGFSSKAAIHPDQIGPIHEVFTPSTEELVWARRVVAAFEHLRSTGALALDGRMLDRPHYLSALRLLARAEVACRRS